VNTPCGAAWLLTVFELIRGRHCGVGSGIQRVLCIPVPCPSACKTRGEVALWVVIDKECSLAMAASQPMENQ
jgi:hypothetical protein